VIPKYVRDTIDKERGSNRTERARVMRMEVAANESRDDNNEDSSVPESHNLFVQTKRDVAEFYRKEELAAAKNAARSTAGKREFSFKSIAYKMKQEIDHRSNRHINNKSQNDTTGSISSSGKPSKENKGQYEKERQTYQQRVQAADVALDTLKARLQYPSPKATLQHQPSRYRYTPREDMESDEAREDAGPEPSSVDTLISLEEGSGGSRHDGELKLIRNKTEGQEQELRLVAEEKVALLYLQISNMDHKLAIAEEHTRQERKQKLEYERKVLKLENVESQLTKHLHQARQAKGYAEEKLVKVMERMSQLDLSLASTEEKLSAVIKKQTDDCIAKNAHMNEVKELQERLKATEARLSNALAGLRVGRDESENNKTCIQMLRNMVEEKEKRIVVVTKELRHKDERHQNEIARMKKPEKQIDVLQQQLHEKDKQLGKLKEELRLYQSSLPTTTIQNKHLIRSLEKARARCKKECTQRIALETELRSIRSLESMSRCSHSRSNSHVDLHLPLPIGRSKRDNGRATKSDDRILVASSTSSDSRKSGLPAACDAVSDDSAALPTADAASKVQYTTPDQALGGEPTMNALVLDFERLQSNDQTEDFSNRNRNVSSPTSRKRPSQGIDEQPDKKAARQASALSKEIEASREALSERLVRYRQNAIQCHESMIASSPKAPRTPSRDLEEKDRAKQGADLVSETENNGPRDVAAQATMSEKKPSAGGQPVQDIMIGKKAERNFQKHFEIPVGCSNVLASQFRRIPTGDENYPIAHEQADEEKKAAGAEGTKTENSSALERAAHVGLVNQLEIPRPGTLTNRDQVGLKPRIDVAQPVTDMEKPASPGWLQGKQAQRENKMMLGKSTDERPTFEKSHVFQVQALTSPTESYCKRKTSSLSQVKREEDMLAGVPIHIKDMYHKVGFVKDRTLNQYLPVLCVQPFSMPPGPAQVRVTSEQRDFLGVYIYGRSTFSSAYQCIKWFKMIPYGKAAEKGFHNLPVEIEEKIASGTPLLAAEEELVQGLEQVKKDLVKEPEERRHPFLRFQQDGNDAWGSIAAAEPEQLLGADHRWESHEVPIVASDLDEHPLMERKLSADERNIPPVCVQGEATQQATEEHLEDMRPSNQDLSNAMFLVKEYSGKGEGLPTGDKTLRPMNELTSVLHLTSQEVMDVAVIHPNVNDQTGATFQKCLPGCHYDEPRTDPCHIHSQDMLVNEFQTNVANCLASRAESEQNESDGRSSGPFPSFDYKFSKTHAKFSAVVQQFNSMPSTPINNEAFPKMKVVVSQQTRWNGGGIPKYVIVDDDGGSECVSEIDHGEVVYGPMELEESDKFMLMLQQILDDVTEDDNWDLNDANSLSSDQNILNVGNVESTVSRNDIMETLGYPSDELTGRNEPFF
jgi:hypothetical protein